MRLTATGLACLQVPLNSLDLSHVSILYTQGEMAAITPIYVRHLPETLPILEQLCVSDYVL